MSSRFLTTFIATCLLGACAPATPSATPMGEAPPSATSVVSPPTQVPAPTSTAQRPTDTPAPSPTPGWKDGWVDFTNSHYGYKISVPAAATVTKQKEILGYNLDDVPPDWNPADNFFEYLNMTYPPGLCVNIEYEGAFINIAAADSVGGKFGMDCRSFGGLGEGNWVWTEEAVTVGDGTSTATVVRRCDEHDQNCQNATYGLQSGDGTHFVLFNVGANNQDVLFEILRSFRPAEKTELYCPTPAPTRLKEGDYAFVSTDPPLAYNNVRVGPGMNRELIEKIGPGEVVQLLEGPICNNSLQWWKVFTLRSGLYGGWTPEGDHRSYWLVPCESKEACGLPE